MMFATGATSGDSTLLGVVTLALLGLWVWCLVVWIRSIVDIVRRPHWHWQLAHKDRTAWLVLVILIGAVSLYYWFWLRKDLDAAARSGTAGPHGAGWAGGGWPPAGPATAPDPAFPVVAVAEPERRAGPDAGWFPDPSGQAGSRWWDGVGWSAFTRP